MRVGSGMSWPVIASLAMVLWLWGFGSEERERESTDIVREKRNNETRKVCWNY